MVEHAPVEIGAYLHFVKGSVAVTDTQAVAVGDFLANAGDMGNAPCGAYHLHYALHTHPESQAAVLVTFPSAFNNYEVSTDLGGSWQKVGTRHSQRRRVGTATGQSDEDDASSGSGNASPDAADIGTGTLRLRAERGGTGDGRVYLIVAKTDDGSGNTAHDCCTVTVPRGTRARASPWRMHRQPRPAIPASPTARRVRSSQFSKAGRIVSRSRRGLTSASADPEGTRQLVEADDEVYALLTATGSRPPSADAPDSDRTSRVIADRRF